VKELLPLLPRPSRYLGNEWGVALKDPSLVRGRIALAFPDMYEVGMSYLGQKILTQAINDRPDLLAERVYSPCQDAAAILRAHNTPLATLETDTELRRMDAVGFSLTHELCYTNVLYMLDLAQIPLRAKDRMTGGPDTEKGDGKGRGRGRRRRRSLAHHHGRRRRLLRRRRPWPTSSTSWSWATARK